MVVQMLQAVLLMFVLIGTALKYQAGFLFWVTTDWIMIMSMVSPALCETLNEADPLLHGHGCVRLACKWRCFLTWDYLGGAAGGMLGSHHVHCDAGPGRQGLGRWRKVLDHWPKNQVP